MNSTIKALLIAAAIASGQSTQAAGFAPWSEGRTGHTEESTTQVRVAQVGFAPWTALAPTHATATATATPTLAVNIGLVGFAPWIKPNA